MAKPPAPPAASASRSRRRGSRSGRHWRSTLIVPPIAAPPIGPEPPGPLARQARLADEGDGAAGRGSRSRRPGRCRRHCPAPLSTSPPVPLPVSVVGAGDGDAAAAGRRRPRCRRRCRARRCRDRRRSAGWRCRSRRSRALPPIWTLPPLRPSTKAVPPVPVAALIGREIERAALAGREQRRRCRRSGRCRRRRRCRRCRRCRCRRGCWTTSTRPWPEASTVALPAMVSEPPLVAKISASPPVRSNDASDRPSASRAAETSALPPTRDVLAGAGEQMRAAAGEQADVLLEGEAAGRLRRSPACRSPR